jgi:competence protein ComEA
VQGPFGSLENLDRVAGVGPGLLKLIAPHVVFSGAEAQRGSGAVNSASSLSSCGNTTAPRPRCPAVPLNLNTASLTELDALPGLGPSRAAAILQYREEHGSFASLEDLGQVPGLGPAAVAKLRGYLAVP